MLLNIVRLLASALAAFMLGLLLAPMAYADYPATPRWIAYSVYYSTPDPACLEYFNGTGRPDLLPHTTVYVNDDQYGCVGNNANQYATATRSFTCPSGTLTGQTCSGDPPATCTAGANSPFESGRTNALAVCQGGCIVDVGSGAGDGATNKWTYLGKQSGVTCAAQPGTAAPPVVGPSPPLPAPCATGTCSGTVNSVAVCLPCGAPGTQPGVQNKSATTNPDGSGSKTSSGSQTNADGSTTNTGSTQTYGTDGLPTGNPTNTTSTGSKNPSENPQAEYCKDNPTSPMCKKGTFTGTCGSSFVCDGDGVQCAIAKEQHIRNCKLFDETNDLTALAAKMAAGTDPVLNPAAVANRETAPISGLMDRARMLSSSCPADMAFSYAGQSVTIPFAQLCTPMQWLGVLAVALTLLVGVRITLGT